MMLATLERDVKGILKDYQDKKRVRLMASFPCWVYPGAHQAHKVCKPYMIGELITIQLMELERRPFVQE